MRLVRSLGLLLALIILVSACGGSGSPAQIVSEDNDGYHGALLETPYVVPPVRLTDTHGEPFTLAEDDRDLDVVFFGYTNCPDVCQVVMGNIASAYQRLDSAQQKRIRVVFVTTDPARDDARQLTSYLARFNPDFAGVTGSLSDIDTLGKSMGIFIKKGAKLPSGGYEVSHTTSITAVTRGKAPLVWTNGLAPKQLSQDIVKLLRTDG